MNETEIVLGTIERCDLAISYAEILSKILCAADTDADEYADIGNNSIIIERVLTGRTIIHYRELAEDIMVEILKDKREHIEILRTLITKYGANPTYNFNRALCYACANGHEKSLDLLIDSGADIEQSAGTPLQIAITHNQIGIINKLLHNGVIIRPIHVQMLDTTNHKMLSAILEYDPHFLDSFPTEAKKAMMG